MQIEMIRTTHISWEDEHGLNIVETLKGDVITVPVNVAYDLMRIGRGKSVH